MFRKYVRHASIHIGIVTDTLAQAAGMKRTLRSDHNEQSGVMDPSGSPEAIQPSVKRRKTQSAETSTSLLQPSIAVPTRVSARQPPRKPRAPTDPAAISNPPLSTIKGKETAGKSRIVAGVRKEVSGEGKDGNADTKKGGNTSNGVAGKGKGKVVDERSGDGDSDRDASGDDDSGSSGDDWTPENNKEGAVESSEDETVKVEAEADLQYQAKKSVVPAKSELMHSILR